MYPSNVDLVSYFLNHSKPGLPGGESKIDFLWMSLGEQELSYLYRALSDLFKNTEEMGHDMNDILTGGF